MDILISGLPLSAKGYLADAAKEAFGEGVVEIVEIEADRLRSRVRLARGNVADVLVVLDSVSAGKCSDIEAGLYSSDKYHEYTSDENLVAFLNAKYEINLVAEKAESLVVPDGNAITERAELDETISKLRNQVAERDSLIETLRCQIVELRQELEEDLEFSSEGSSGSSEEDLAKIKDLESQVSTLREENIKFRDQISSLNVQVKKAEDGEIAVRRLIAGLTDDADKTKLENNRLKADYTAVKTELDGFKVKNSDLQGLLDIREREVEELKKATGDSGKVLDELEASKQEVESLREEMERVTEESEEYRSLLEKEKAKTGELVSENTSLKDEVDALTSRANNLSDQVKEIAVLQDKIDTLELEKVKLNAQLVEGTSVEDEEKYKAEIESLKDRVNEYDKQIVLLNAELVKAKSDVEMLEKSTDRDTDIEEMYQELSDLKNRYLDLSQGVFGKMANYANPKSSVMVDLIRGGDMYNHIRFAFSGSTESRKGTYRALLEEFKGIPEEDIVIVDAVCETCVDYVFEVKKVVNGLDWFVKGGGINKYLSETCLPNVKVLSPGLGYMNDCYFLTVDWEERLRELDESGYNVVVYCGDISSLVGRVLHESFAGRSASMVYVHGNAIGARTLITNVKGISNSKESIICYFEYNKRVERFYETIQKDGHECRIISMV